MATVAELRAQAAEAAEAALQASEKAAELKRAVIQAEYEERQAKESVEAKEHDERMYSEIGQPAGLNKAQHSIVYALAYQDGHPYGYGEVQYHYLGLAEMARQILEAN